MENENLEKEINSVMAKLKEAIELITTENKDFEKSENILLDIVKESEKYEETEEMKYLNFNDAIDFALYIQINKPKKSIKWLEIPFFSAYAYLAFLYNEQQRYEEAAKASENAMKWNPMEINSLFEKCEIHRIKKDMEAFYKETLTLYDKIFKPIDLAHFYRNLGYYYVEMNKLDVAYALYTASTKFERNNNAFEEMEYINQLLKRESYTMPGEEGLRLLEEVNVPFGPKKENLDLLLGLYYAENGLTKQRQLESMLANRIYRFTSDKKFGPFKTYTNNVTMCEITVPRSWAPIKEEIRNEKFGKKNMFALSTDTNALFMASYVHTCSEENFDEECKKGINIIVNSPNEKRTLCKEGTKMLKTVNGGNRKVNYAVIDIEGNGKVYRNINYFTLVNGYITNFCMDLDKEIDFNDEEKFNNQKNMVDLNNVMFYLKEFENPSVTIPKAIEKVDEMIEKLEAEKKLQESSSN